MDQEVEEINDEIEQDFESNEIQQLSETITLKEVHSVFRKWLYLPDVSALDIALATCCSIRFCDPPLWIFLVGPPSSGKTEILRALAPSNSKTVDTLTSHTLVSGFRKGKGGKDPSVFRDINNKTLIIKDFTGILTLRSEQRIEIFNQLRGAYDGYFDFKCGSFPEDIRYKTHFACLGGVTEIIDNYTGFESALGQRFLFYRIRPPERKELSKKLRSNRHKKNEMQRELRVAASALIERKARETKEGEQQCFTDEFLDRIDDLAWLVAKLRGSVPRDWHSREVNGEATSEGEARIQSQLYLLAESLVFIRGKQGPDEEEYKLLYKLAFDCVPPLRLRAIKLLDSEKEITTAGIGQGLQLQTATTLRLLEDLFKLEICQRTSLKEGTSYLWQFNPEFEGLWEQSLPIK